MRRLGVVAERSKAHAWKVCMGLKSHRGFESHPLRQIDAVLVMAARVCIFATNGHEPRQARKGAAVEALSRAPKSKLARAASFSNKAKLLV